MKIDYPVPEQTAQLRRLWQAVFQDPADYIDGFFRLAFEPARCRIVETDGKVAAMAHWFDMTCRGKKMAYLYAVATDRVFRERGYCRSLMEDICRLLERQGYAGLLLVPQNEGVIAMYEKMGFRFFGGINRFFCEAGEPVAITSVDCGMYQALRAEFLPEGGVMLDDIGAAYLASMAEFYRGVDFLMAAVREGEVLHGIELLGNAGAAPGILTALDCTDGSFLTPGETSFAMYRSLDGTPPPDYLGIAFD